MHSDEVVSQRSAKAGMAALGRALRTIIQSERVEDVWDSQLYDHVHSIFLQRLKIDK